MLATRQLQMMAGGPRGRSGGGVSIEGADGARVILASAMPMDSIRPRISVDADEYEDSGKPSPPPLLKWPSVFVVGVILIVVVTNHEGEADNLTAVSCDFYDRV